MSVVLPYDERRGTSGVSIRLPVSAEVFEPFPVELIWRDIHLLKKDEFHVTLLNVDTASALSRRPREEIISFFNSFVARHPITLQSFMDDFRYVEEDVRATILVRSVVSNTGLLFKELNHTFEIEMPTQPAHVTIYTLQKNVGIHVPSVEVMEGLESVHIQELESALSNMRP